MPLTGEDWRGFLLLVTRPTDGDHFEARSVGGVGIFPCEGGRDKEAAKRLSYALNALFASPPPRASMPDRPIQAAPRVQSVRDPIKALHRGEPSANEADRVWFAGPGFWLERKPAD
jgi:hypothetical protein